MCRDELGIQWNKIPAEKQQFKTKAVHVEPYVTWVWTLKCNFGETDKNSWIWFHMSSLDLLTWNAGHLVKTLFWIKCACVPLCMSQDGLWWAISFLWGLCERIQRAVSCIMERECAKSHISNTVTEVINCLFLYMSTDGRPAPHTYTYTAECL